LVDTAHIGSLCHGTQGVQGKQVKEHNRRPF